MRGECEVRENCLQYTRKREQCWACEDYSLYLPEDKRVLSPRQVKDMQARKAEKIRMKQTDASKRGKKSKRKGYSGENELVKLLQKWGHKVERVPLSGALRSEAYGADVTLPGGKRGEVKRRKAGLKTVYDWLEQDSYSDMVFFRADYKNWIVIMPIEEYAELLERGRDND